MKLSFSQKECLFIVVSWLLLYASTPLYLYYGLWAINQDFMWHEVWSMWSYLTAFLLLFLLNHYVLIPKMVVRKRVGGYIAVIMVLLALFVCFLRWQAPIEPPHFINEPKDVSPMKKIILLAPPDLARFVIALLMLGMDLGVVAWFNEQKMRQRLLLLEQQNLKQELDQLRYQINPHFFMNTLNNIHMLIDIDQESAKRSIVELSRMMRYSLYEGSSSMVPLEKELEFVRLYISLMKLRYTDKVQVTCDMPEHLLGDVKILPLLLPTFVENAFKHGVSYLEPSYIHVALSLSDDGRTMEFRCVNSRHDSSSATRDSRHGIGLENVKKRLDLKYSDTYCLTIDDSDEHRYAVSLVIPV